MHEECSGCGLKFNREPGFFFGFSIYINYGLTALLMSITYVSLLLAGVASPKTLLWAMLAFCVCSRSGFFATPVLWLGFDQYWDPRRNRSSSRAAIGAAPNRFDETKTGFDKVARTGNLRRDPNN